MTLAKASMCAKLEQETCLRATKYGKCGANETQRGSLAIQMSWQGGGTTQRDRLIVTVESLGVTLPCWWRRSHTVGLVPCGWEVHLVQVNVPRTRFPSAWLLQ